MTRGERKAALSYMGVKGTTEFTDEDIEDLLSTQVEDFKALEAKHVNARGITAQLDYLKEAEVVPEKLKKEVVSFF